MPLGAGFRRQVAPRPSTRGTHLSPHSVQEYACGLSTRDARQCRTGQMQLPARMRAVRTGSCIVDRRRVVDGQRLSARRRLRSTVEPDQPRFDRADAEYPRLCPGVLSEARSDVLLVGRLNEVQRSVVVTDRAAEDHEAVIDKRVHERRMAVPVALLADLPPRIPGRPVNDSYGEGSHAQTVDASTDNPAATRT